MLAKACGDPKKEKDANKLIEQIAGKRLALLLVSSCLQSCRVQPLNVPQASLTTFHGTQDMRKLVGTYAYNRYCIV